MTSFWKYAFSRACCIDLNLDYYENPKCKETMDRLRSTNNIMVKTQHSWLKGYAVYLMGYERCMYYIMSFFNMVKQSMPTATVNKLTHLSKMSFLRSNARLHIPKLTHKTTVDLDWDVLPHAAYSPPSDCHLFRSM